ncbi:RHS repeat-associated core domain-containing protein [Acinetobacter nosocomialis]|uniref:RHS repeat domain-containing protein n=1 Tax=Acinetobacter nosocomialis TaxID=106654 RepID=UPI002708F767|nr:RHS repeat-associated core domain-containing protein [Acinetobacter nosocomialis]MDO7540441.1 RHS repeat-associated core domain-containing protein [Acinetobacter nosocomialis]
MKKIFNKVILFLLTWLSLSICFAAGTDYSALTNNLALEPSIQGATKGYDLLSGKVIQNIPLVKGNLPFTMQYHASLRLESEGGANLYQELDEGGLADWSNEYSGQVITSTIPSSNTSVFIIQLPGSSEKYLISREEGKILKRIYYNGAGQFEAKTFYSEYLRDISFNQINGSIVIVKDGVKYTASIYKNMESVFGSTTIPSYLYKFTEIQYQDGRKLNLSYDNGYNLVQVKDNRNNTLNILREYKKFGSLNQTYLERKLITGVELISGSNVQRSSITYQENQVKSIIDPSKTETRYTISSINSIVAGNFSFQYVDESRGYWIQYILNNTSRKITSSSEGNYPILKRVIDQNNNVLREYEYGNTWQFYNSTSVFLAYTTQITAYTPINNQKTQRSISAWNDMRGEFANRFTVNGQDQAMDYTMTGASLPGTYNQADLGLMSSATATMTVQGNYPGLLNGSTPIRSVQFNPFTHRLKSITDLNGNVSTFNYDQLNRLSQKTIASGTADTQSTTYNYTVLTDGTENRYPTPNEIVTDGQKVTNSINANGWIVQQVISYPKGGTSKTIAYSYYSNPNNVDYGLISNVDGPRSDVDDSTTFTYDAFGNKATMVQNVNNRSVVTKYLNYNSFAQPERIVYPSGLVDLFIYNADGTLQAKVIGNGGESGNITGPVTRFSYDYLKRKKSETNADNESILYDYDSVGRLVKTTMPDGSVTIQTYFDNDVLQTVEGTVNTYNEINVQGRIAKSRTGTDPNSNWKTFVYDGNGNIIQTQTALGIVEKWTFDALNRNISYTNGKNETSTKNYDKSDNLISSKDSANSGSNPFNYVSSTLVKSEINNDYGTKTYNYNQADQMISKSHGNRSCNYSTIDSIGRIGEINCYSENDGDPAFAYNYQYIYDNSRFGLLDRVSSNTSFGVNTNYNYDALNRVVGKTQTNKALTTWGGTNSSLSVGYNYSPAGKITSINMPSGRTINYNYDGNKGYLTSIQIAGNPFINNISYDKYGQLYSWNIENTNAKYLINYDNAQNGEIKAISFNNKNNISLYAEEYSFDSDRRITKISYLNNHIKNFTYSNYNQLLSETKFIGDFKEYTIYHGYRSNGNKSAISYPENRTGYMGVMVDFKDISNSNRFEKITRYIQKARGVDFYDFSMKYLPTGELVNVGLYNTYTSDYFDLSSSYDGSGQIRYIRGQGGQYYMAYNHKNERTVRALNTSGSWYAGAVQYVYDENSNLLGEYTANGTPIVEYVWMGNRPVAAIYGLGSDKIYAVVTDHNATPRMLVDNVSGNAVWEWDSTAFGVGYPTRNLTFNLRFPGQYYDEFTGLHYNLNRYYSPEFGRYMEADPIGLEGGSNPYAYAENNPLSNVDPSGLFSYENPVFNYADALGLGVNTIGKWFTSSQSSLEPYDFGMNQFQWKELAETNSIEFYYAVKFGMETDTSMLADSIKYRAEYNTMKYLEFNDYLQKNVSYNFNNSALKTAELVSTIFTGAGRGSIFDARDQLSSAQQIGSDVGQAINLTRHLQFYNQPMYINENLYKKIWNQNGFNSKAVRFYSERRR